MNTPIAQFCAKLWQRTTFWRTGTGLAILAVAFVVLRLLWIQIQRPAHLEENAALWGSIRDFSGMAQMNHDGSQLTYVAPANDRGHAVFLADATTGKKRQILEDTNGVRIGDAEFDIYAGPWSPDDSAFVCLVDKRIVICDAQSGRSTGDFTLPTVPGRVTWLTPAKIMCMTDGKLHELDRQTNGTWISRETAVGGLERRSSLDAISVSASQSAPGAGADNAMDEDGATTWYSGKTTDPVWLQCQFSGLTWAITHYTLASLRTDAATASRDWQLLGSNDATNWVVLDTRNNETFTAGEPAKEYDFSNETPYWFYRLNVTATAGGSGVRLAEFQLYSRATPTIASASSENPAGESASAAFDGSVKTKWFNHYENTPAWLQYQIGGRAGAALSEYSLTSGEDYAPARDPGAWEFQASNDGVTWITLDTRSGESFESRFLTKAYSFKNVTPYRIYRLYITQNHGTDQYNLGGVQLAELDLGLKELLARIGNPDGGMALRNLGTDVVSTASDARIRSPRALRPDELTHWFSGSAKGPVWRQSEFKDGAWVIRQYKLISSSTVPATDPRDWQLLASNDGVKWAMLDSQSNQVFSTRGRAKRYPIPNQTAYRFYRLNITANAAGNDSGVHLGEFQLWSEDTPAMASASAENAPGEGVVKAFDGDPNTKWFNGGAGGIGWLQYKFGGGQAQVLSRYALTSGNDVPARDPKNWQFQASNDGQTWTTLNKQENQTFESRLQTKTYSFFNDQSYRFYRLNILANGGDASLQLSELALGEAQSAPPSSPNPGASDDARTGTVGSNDNPFYKALSLTALDSKTIAWGQPDCLWSLSVGDENPRLLVDLRSALPPNTRLLRYSYSKKTGQFLLNCDTGGALSLWRFDPNRPTDLAKIADNASDGYWIDTGAAPGEFVYANLAASHPRLMRADSDGKVTQLLAPGNYDWFQVTPDQKQVFVLGCLSNQPVTGIWRYDVASSAWHPVISSSDNPSPHAQGVITLQQNMNLPGGNVPVTIYRPANWNPHKKYPLLIGDTVVDASINGAPFLKSVAACGACVAVVGRPYWAGGIEHWVENVQGLYDQMKHDPTVDTSRVYLFAVSAETYYLSQMVATNSAPWRGLLLLTPGALPDFSRSSPFQSRPKILIDAGGEEHQEDQFKQYQANALKSGVMVEYYTHPGETHFMVGADWTRKRVMEEKHFIFEE